MTNFFLYGEITVQRHIPTATFPYGKIPYGEISYGKISLRRNFLTVKIPYDEDSIRRKFLRQNFPQRYFIQQISQRQFLHILQLFSRSGVTAAATVFRALSCFHGWSGVDRTSYPALFNVRLSRYTHCYIPKRRYRGETFSVYWTV